MKRSKQFLFIGIAAWGFLTLFIGYVLVTPDNPLTKMYRAPVEQISERVVTGPYPVATDLKQLHAKGITSDISLLDPKIPYERVLINREQKSAEQLGIHFYDFPVASILGQRFGSYYDAHVHAAARTIDSLENDAKGDKVYVHCYLGQHRLAAVRNALLAQDSAVAPDGQYAKASVSR